LPAEDGMPVREAVLGEMDAITAALAGEMAVADVPVAPGVDLARLKEGDADPLEVVVSVPAGKSARGWDYRPEALEDIVRQVASETAAGYLGHQEAGKVATEFPVPVTHWVGAKWDPAAKVAYFRGVVDAAATDLKRWIRAGRINSTSIFGIPRLVKGPAGETQVVGYRLLSIDWTPRGRAGMPTAVVAMGEQSGGERMDLNEVMGELRRLGAQPKAVLEGMGWGRTQVLEALASPWDEVAGELGGEAFAGLRAEAALAGEIREVLGLPGDASAEVVRAAVTAAREAQAAGEARNWEELLDRVIGEMVPGEAVRPVVRDLVVARLAPGASEEVVRAAVGEIARKDYVRGLFGGMAVLRPAAGEAAGVAGGGNLRPVRRAI
jgi:hypothetical protein